MDRILLATDGSESAVRAAEFAGRLSASWDAPVDIIHVVPPRNLHPEAAIEAYGELEHTYITLRDLQMGAGKEIVEREAQRVRDAGGELGAMDVLVGAPAHEIADYAEGHGDTILVMGRRGLGNLRGLLMGSVSHRVGQLTDRTLITTE